jgi:hypothetical protein
MRFEVPQFIDVEDKIFGPLTFKQFLYLAGGAGLAYVSYKFIPFPFWIVISAALVVFALLLAFYKLNNRPFIEVAQNWLTFMLKGKLYIWERSKPIFKQPEPTPPPKAPEKVVTEKTIQDLAQNLDILDNYRQ